MWSLINSTPQGLSLTDVILQIKNVPLSDMRFPQQQWFVLCGILGYDTTGVEVQRHSFLPMALHEEDWSVHVSAVLASVRTEEARLASEQVWRLCRIKYLLPLSGIKPWSVSCLSHIMMQIRIYGSKLNNQFFLEECGGHFEQLL